MAATSGDRAMSSEKKCVACARLDWKRHIDDTITTHSRSIALSLYRKQTQACWFDCVYLKCYRTENLNMFGFLTLCLSLPPAIDARARERARLFPFLFVFFSLLCSVLLRHVCVYSCVRGACYCWLSSLSAIICWRIAVLSIYVETDAADRRRVYSARSRSSQCYGVLCSVQNRCHNITSLMADRAWECHNNVSVRAFVSYLVSSGQRTTAAPQ